MTCRSASSLIEGQACDWHSAHLMPDMPMPRRVRRFAFSPFLNQNRDLIERFVSEPKHFRAFATRYDKHGDSYLASVQLASIRFWLRHNEPVT